MQESKTGASYLSALDVDGDGKVDIHDFLALFGSRKTETANTPALEDRVSDAWRRKGRDLEILSTSIRNKVDLGHALAKNSRFSRTDRRINSILKRLQLDFDDKNLEKLRSDYLKCLHEIKSTDEKISDLIAHVSLASEKDRSKAEKQLERSRDVIEKLRATRRRILVEFVENFSVYNVEISLDQAEVLLSRIDSDDVTRMTSVFAIVSQLTIQFSEAKQASGENTSTAQKYYAMYIGLLELQELVQSEYIRKVDDSYLPGVSEIKKSAEQLIAETQILMRSMPKDHLRSYEHNLQSQEFTLKVAGIYGDALIEDRTRVIRAREIVRNLLRLAENTLKTVKVASDLVSLMKDSRGLYDEVMQLQTPSLMPFENLELKREFQAVTEKLKATP